MHTCAVYMCTHTHTHYINGSCTITEKCHDQLPFLYNYNNYLNDHLSDDKENDKINAK